jgi:glutathione synthase/RimK-type ligase-like ATP-grasp enzyme
MTPKSLKILIIYGNILESSEIKFNELLNSYENINSIIKSINDIDHNELKNIDMVFNRVYASQGNSDNKILKKTILFLDTAERLGIKCLNSSIATQSDYSKIFAYEKCKLNNILQPDSIFVDNADIKVIKEFLNKHKTVIVKRNSSGRGINIIKTDNLDEILNHIDQESKNYSYGFIIQEFKKSILPHDFRIGIINGKFLFSYGRTLTKINDKDENWIASVSNGSQIIDYEPTKEQIETAIKSTNSIGAFINEVDMIQTSEGPCIIENNPTPNYGKKSFELGHVEKFIETFIKEL